MTDTLIPAPQSLQARTGWFRCGPPDAAAAIRSDNAAARAAVDWFVQRLERDHGILAATSDGFGPMIHLRLLSPPDADLPGDATSPPFATAAGQEQGYLLDVSEDAVEIAAMTAHGLQNGAATLLQLLSRTEAGLVAPCCRIEDWPDTRFRAAADWLLNAEINRWGYERGDGLEATITRMKRKLDQAAAYKINVVWFDGFGWEADRTPWYAAFARELSDYARQRHIRLAFSGYGGGYGASYQAGSIYFGRYHGRAFRNRHSYPDGSPYNCVGHPSYPTSWTYGTCLSNVALADLKLAELTDFVTHCRPGFLYVHDIDTGELMSSQAGWKQRCPQCRKQWPEDEMASSAGAAGAYASWFRRVVDAVNVIVSDDGEYAAGRDCEIIFVGPTYSGCHDSDDIWAAHCDYSRVLSHCLGPAPNVEFGIREQFVSDTPPGLRVPMLKDALDAAGCGHGVFVVPFVGGDNYYSDQLVSTAGALHRYWQGATTVYISSMSSVGEPGQLLCANYAWHADAPGSYAPADTRAEAMELRDRCAAGIETRSDIHGPEGLLSRACQRLYGTEAGPALTELFALGAGAGAFPLATGWRRAADEVPVLESGAGDDDGSRAAHWRRREELTAAALELVSDALGMPLPTEGVRADLQWLSTGLSVGRRICRALCACWEWRSNGAEHAHTRARSTVDEVRRYLADTVPTTTTDPVGGDIVIWRLIVDKLDALSGC